MPCTVLGSTELEVALVSALNSTGGRPKRKDPGKRVFSFSGFLSAKNIEAMTTPFTTFYVSKKNDFVLSHTISNILFYHIYNSSL